MAQKNKKQNKMPPKASQLKNETQKCNNALLFWSAVPGYCIDRLQPFQCLIFVAVCHSVASFSTSVLHFSQSLHVGNLISQCFNKSNSLLGWDLKPFFAFKTLLLLLPFILFGTCFILSSCYFCLNLNYSNSGGSGTQWWHSGQTILHARETAVHPQEVQWGGESSGLRKEGQIYRETKKCRDRRTERFAILALIL